MNKKYWWNWSWRIKNIDVTEVVDIKKKLFSNTVSFGEKGLK